MVRTLHGNKRAYSSGGQARFKNPIVTEPTPREWAALRATSPAVVEGRTMFPSRVFDASERKQVLIEGINNAKTGNQIVVGPWAGMRHFNLSLEERATCPRSCAQWDTCFAPDTRILTADLRWVPISALHIGQKICAFDEELHPKTKRRHSRFAVVEGLKRIRVEAFRIVTDQGEVIASGDHRWIARRDEIGRRTDRKGFRWLSTNELAPHSRIQFFHSPWDEDRSYEAGRLRGFVEGEGHTVCSTNSGFPKANLGWSQVPGELLNEINEIAISKGFPVFVRKTRGGVNHSEIIHVNLTGGWRQILRFMGSIRPSRLDRKTHKMWENHVFDGRASIAARVIRIEPLGLMELVQIATSTKTLIANGFLAHNCFGNGMPVAVRFNYNDALMMSLDGELEWLSIKHPNGFSVRLHILGDFPDMAYLQNWIEWSDTLPELHVWGYTAHPANGRIGKEIMAMNRRRPDRWQVRFSVAEGTPHAPMQVATTWKKPERYAFDPTTRSLICPQEIGKTDHCSTCGICWNPKMENVRIRFLGHGNVNGKRAHKSTAEISEPVDKKPQISRLVDRRGSQPNEKFSDVAAFIAARGVTRIPAGKARL